MDEIGDIDVRGEEMEENRPVRSPLIFRMLLHLERRTNIGMSHKPTDVSDDASEMMSADLTIIVIMVIRRARVIVLRLTYELDEIDIIMTTLDLLLLLRLVLTSVLRHHLLNLTLGLIRLIPD